MGNNAGRTWRQGAQFAALLVSWAVGAIFGILGKNPFDPVGLWGEKPQNGPFLWTSVIACVVAVVLSYTLWPQVRVETARKDLPGGKEPPSRWYGDWNTMQVSWLAYWVFIPGLCLAWMLRDLAEISHLAMFSWLADAAFLVAIVVDIVAVALMIKGFRKRARERKMEQQASR